MLGLGRKENPTPFWKICLDGSKRIRSCAFGHERTSKMAWGSLGAWAGLLFFLGEQFLAGRLQLVGPKGDTL